MRLRLPNLRAANPQHIETFGKHMQRGVDQQQEQMQQLLACDDNPAAHLNAVASRLTAVLRRSAFACFPITGSAPYKSRDMLQLDVSTVQSLGCFACPQASWPRLPVPTTCASCAVQSGGGSTHGASSSSTCSGPSMHTTTLLRRSGSRRLELLNRVRTAIRKEEERMQRSHRTPLEANPAAQVHRMLDSSELPAQIHAVVDKNGDLTATSQELEDALVDHFSSVFLRYTSSASCPRPSSGGSASDAPLEGQRGSAVVRGIARCNHRAGGTLDAVGCSADLVLRPGRGLDRSVEASPAEQSSPLHAHRILVLVLPSTHSTFPAAWKTSVIVPLLKDALKEHGHEQPATHFFFF